MELNINGHPVLKVDCNGSYQISDVFEVSCRNGIIDVGGNYNAVKYPPYIVRAAPASAPMAPKNNPVREPLFKVPWRD